MLFIVLLSFSPSLLNPLILSEFFNVISYFIQLLCLIVEIFPFVFTSGLDNLHEFKMLDFEPEADDYENVLVNYSLSLHLRSSVFNRDVFLE